MDPQFRRKAHREWFLDGLGFLRIAKERLKFILLIAYQIFGLAPPSGQKNFS